MCVYSQSTTQHLGRTPVVIHTTSCVRSGDYPWKLSVKLKAQKLRNLIMTMDLSIYLWVIRSMRCGNRPKVLAEWQVTANNISRTNSFILVLLSCNLLFNSTTRWIVSQCRWVLELSTALYRGASAAKHQPLPPFGWPGGLMCERRGGRRLVVSKNKC